ncbi:uncharacterized protein LOC113276237 [Papaver somniferum]|uniref:uncharacterized protein LOC113276237 n=1 Tax=Papaver somniferum TaxID=3469 RepID=UPI000E6FCF09|nr:uncharacterized protein LOC113276237 [Papaver somniferum]
MDPADNITSGLLFKGALHWLGSTTHQHSSSEVIVSFDVSSEKLVDLSFPEEAMPPPSHRYGSVHKNVGVLGDCLCLSFIDGYQVDLWVMQDHGVRESWTKQLTTSTQLSVIRYSRCNPIWYLESGEILMQAPGDLVLYHQKNEKARSVRFYGVDMGMGSIGDSYLESVVSLKSGTYVEKRERSINGDLKKPPRRLGAAKVNVSAHWTDDMEQEFCELLVEQMVGGNVPNLLGNAAWGLIKDEFNRKMGESLSVNQIKSRYYMLRSRYKEITRFMSLGGLRWDPDEKKVVVEDERVWEAYVKENPDEACYKTLSCPIYEELCVLFGDSPVTKFHAPAENNDVEAPNLPFKQGSSASNRQEEVGENSNAECNYRGKRIAPSTSKCGPSKKAAINSSGSNDATTRIYVPAVDLQNDPYSIPNCTKHLQSLKGVSIQSIMAALEKFQDVGWRQVFMSLEPSLQKEWLKSIGS